MRNAQRETSFTAYVTVRRRRLRHYAFLLCGDWHLADDLLQTALAKLYVAWPRIEREQAQDAYVRRIIARSLIDESRRPWRRETPGLDGLDDEVAPPEAADSPDLSEALASLPPMQRAVVVLRHWLDLSVDDTATELGIAPGTVKSHHHKAMANLRRFLDPTDLSTTTPHGGTP